jgi:hypothetical protein
MPACLCTPTVFFSSLSTFQYNFSLPFKSPPRHHPSAHQSCHQATVVLAAAARSHGKRSASSRPSSTHLDRRLCALSRPLPLEMPVRPWATLALACFHQSPGSGCATSLAWEFFNVHLTKFNLDDFVVPLQGLEYVVGERTCWPGDHAFRVVSQLYSLLMDGWHVKPCARTTVAEAGYARQASSTVKIFRQRCATTHNTGTSAAQKAFQT